MKKLFAFLLFGLFMISLGSAMEIDNTKTYDPVTREATIHNTFLGFKTSEVGKARLNTPLNVNVAPGYQKVAEFDLWAYEDYNDALKQFKFVDMKTGQETTRVYDLKYLTYETREVEDYKKTCEDIPGASPPYDRICINEKIGSHLEEIAVWNNIVEADLQEGESWTIGVFTEVKIGDYVDWIPKIYGEEIEEWATWTGDINTGMVSYFQYENLSDSWGSNDGTATGTTNVSGKIGSARNYNGTTQYINYGTDSSLDVTEISLSAWINPSVYTYADNWYLGKWEGTGRSYGLGVTNGGNVKFLLSSVAGDTTITSNVTLSTGTWYYVNAIWDSTTGGEVWVDNVLVGTGNDFPGNIEDSTGDLLTGALATNVLANVEFDGEVDEFMIHDRPLTSDEIDFLYNSGAGRPFQEEAAGDQPPEITLNSPASTNYTSPQSLTINFTAWDDRNLTSVKLYVDDVLNQTNASGINNSVYLFDLDLGDGEYIIYGRAADNESQETNSSSIEINIDSTLPDINITAPTGVLNFILAGENETLNWSVSDNALDSCWYTYDTTNYSINCSLNTTEFVYVGGVNNLTFYANDTFGNIGSEITTWDYTLTELASDFDSPVVEGSTTDITANVTLQAGLRVSSVVLNYNGTEFPGSNVEYATNTYFLSISKLVPEVDADTNVTFFWNVTLEDGSSQETNSNNQTILNVSLDDCSVFTNTIFNFTIVDEATQAILNGAAENTSLKIDLTLSSEDGSTEILQFSKGYSEINPAAICINNEMGNSTLRLDAVVEYTAADKFVEFYNIQEFTFSESTASNNITLYNLEESEGLEFKITYKGQDFIPVTDLILQIQRKYVDEGLFKTIEIPISGSNGYTIAHLVPNDVIYNLIFIKDGSVLDTFTEVVADCQNPTIVECEINLNALITGSDLFSLVEDDTFFSSLTFDKTTREVSSTYGIVSGVSGTTSLNVTLIDNFGNNTACSDSLVAAGGTLTCEVPVSFGDAVVYARVILDDGIKREGYISMKETPKDQYAGVIIFSTIILLLFIFGIGVSDNPGITGVFFILGALLLVGLNVFYSTSWIGAGATILWFIVAVVLVIVKGGSKR